MTVEEKKAVFKADDLDDGKYHWELTTAGDLYTKIAKNLSPELQDAVL